MDLNQQKLSRTEWNNIEIPLEAEEQNILKLLIEGYNDVQIKRNNVLSLLGYLKTCESKPQIVDDFVFIKYLKPRIDKICKTYGYKKLVVKNVEKKIKKIDMIRIQNSDQYIDKQKNNLFEYIILDIIEKLLETHKNNTKWIIHYYTIHVLMTYSIKLFNNNVRKFIDTVMTSLKEDVRIAQLIKNGHELIECNPYILKYADEQLYDHQKELFTICKRKGPKLVLYIAPTGTGKTMSPLGLSEGHKVIFVCAARHVGLALAKAAISMHKKIAFAFGCNDASDIRLHYYAAKEYTRNKRSGRIARVDNSIGDKVEIIICDIKSYLPAMYYMRSFNPIENLITYWDEPTITMDYDTHEFHEIINNNWKKNIIPNMVLSSATLPHQDEIMDTIMDFKSTFDGAELHNIVSYDCKKTIPIINKEGYAELPHFIFENYNDLQASIVHCEKYKTLLRYLDLTEAINLITYVNKNKMLTQNRFYIEHYFQDIDHVTMKNIKVYYLVVLKNINPDLWLELYVYFQKNRVKRQDSNIYVTTKDAHSLTDGPTIFLANDVTKMAKFCIQNSHIPEKVITDISSIISRNNVLNKKLDEMEKTLEDALNKEDGKDNKANDGRMDPSLKQLTEKIDDMRQAVKSVGLNDIFIPNRRDHMQKWASNKVGVVKTAFTSSISEPIVERIMLLHGIEDSWKLLLMMGIGVFTEHDNIAYSEIMKELAYKQQLYLIIASADFIYGTNYQFCHGYISKDLGYISQEKCIQAMGRVGRNKLQQDYSVRFRDNDLIMKLFIKENNKPEVTNMNKLFNS